MRYVLVLMLLIPMLIAPATLPAYLKVIAHKEVPVKHTGEQCKASAIYYEARGEPIESQRAVLDVIEHRKKQRKLSGCQVVKQRHQFSWFPKHPIKEYNVGLQKLYKRVKGYPRVLRDENFQFFFHKDMNPQPKWAESMVCKEIGNHRFCRKRREDEIEESGQHV